MFTDYPFTYDGQPANLKFSEETGELSEIRYWDRGGDTIREIHEFSFNERSLKILVKGEVKVVYADGEPITGPQPFTVDATTQESLAYFEQFTYDYPKIKRQEVNGVSAEYLSMLLFNPETGAFEPRVIPPPTEPV